VLLFDIINIVVYIGSLFLLLQSYVVLCFQLHVFVKVITWWYVHLENGPTNKLPGILAVPQELSVFLLLLTADDDLLMQLFATWQLMLVPSESNLATTGCWSWLKLRCWRVCYLFREQRFSTDSCCTIDFQMAKFLWEIERAQELLPEVLFGADVRQHYSSMASCNTWKKCCDPRQQLEVHLPLSPSCCL
jgi:hypothetical protein